MDTGTRFSYYWIEQYAVGVYRLIKGTGLFMKRIGFILKVKQEKIPEYKKHHEAVWPEMQEALRRTGWHNYTLFIRDDGLIFGYFEAAESLQASQAGMANEPINL